MASRTATRPRRITGGPPGVVSRFGVALAATAAALGATWIFPDSLVHPSFLFFIAAVGVSAWYGGWLPGLLSIALSALASRYFSLEPRWTLRLTGDVGQLRLGLFVLSSVLVVWLFAALKSTQRALQRGHDRFRSAQRSANIGAYDWNIQTGQVFWSEQLPILKGLGSDDRTVTWRQFIHPDDLSRVQSEFARALASGSEIDTDFRIVRPDGKVHWVTSRGQVFYDASGKPERALGVLMDITERKASETRRQAQHAITRALAEAPSVTVAAPRVLQIFCQSLGWSLGQLWIVDPAAGLLRWFGGWHALGEELAGFEAASRTATFVRGAGLPGEVWASTETHWIEDVGKFPGLTRAEAARRAGLRSALAFPIVLAGHVLGVMEFFSAAKCAYEAEVVEMAGDIGAQVGQFIERRRAREALRESEERYRTTLSSIGDAVIATDAQGRIQFINALAQELTGCPATACTGRPLQEVFRLVQEGSRQPVEDPFRRVMQTGAVVTLKEAILLARGGKEIPINDSAAPIRNDQGDLIGVVLVFRDTRGRRRAEEALRASEKLAATGRLAASIAHEINNPMEAVGNLLYLLENHARLDDNSRQYVALAQQELDRMAKIVKQTLAFYREATQPESLRITAVLDDVLELFGRKITRSGIEVRKRYRSAGAVRGFPGEIRQLLSNLLINAIEAAGQDGRIRLHVKPACAPDDPAVPGVRVSVADSGPGIAPGNVSRIFEPFFTTKGEQGTGLGLWVSHGIVHKHGGEIRVRSRTRGPRRGTCFSVFLPAEPVHLPGEEPLVSSRKAA